jgi:uncharacterized membrane protein YdjX (TVP38/TMEM64 family)
MRSRRNTILLTTLIICTAIGLMLVLWLYPHRLQQVLSLFSAESIMKLVRLLQSLGWIGPLVSIGFMMLQAIVAPLPSFVITAANGMVFGIFWGAVISWVGGMAGALLNFWLARKLGYRKVQKWTKNTKWLNKIDEISGQNGFMIILIARLLPIVSFDAISLIAGISRIRYRAFLLATGIGQIPGTLLYVILGHDLIYIEQYQSRLWLVAGILIFLVLMGRWVTGKIIKG